MNAYEQEQAWAEWKGLDDEQQPAVNAADILRSQDGKTDVQRLTEQRQRTLARHTGNTALTATEAHDFFAVNLNIPFAD